MKRLFSRVIWRRVLIFLAVAGPGIIAANADNDAGGISTYTVAGARYGYSMLSSLLVITFVLGITQELGARIGVATGKGLGGVIREKFTLKLTMIPLAAMLIANLGNNIADFAGIAEGMTLFGVSKYIAVPIFAVIMWLILYKGSFKKAEKIFLVVSLFYIVYIITAFYTKPDWGQAVSALVVPHFQMDRTYIITLMALIGTTVTPWGQFFIQSFVVDKGIPPEKYSYQRIEVYLGAFITDLVSFFIIVTAANTLFTSGVLVNTAGEAAQALAPLAGAFAKTLFAFGFVNAGLLGVSITTLATAYALCEAFGFESAMDRTWKEAPVFYSMITILIAISAIVVLIPQIPLFTILILSQALNGLMLPFVLIFVYQIANDARIMGRLTNSRLMNTLTKLSILLLIVASCFVVFSIFLS